MGFQFDGLQTSTPPNPMTSPRPPPLQLRHLRSITSIRSAQQGVGVHRAPTPAGSIRNPSFPRTGIVGLKPTHGLLRALRDHSGCPLLANGWSHARNVYDGVAVRARVRTGIDSRRRDHQEDAGKVRKTDYTLKFLKVGAHQRPRLGVARETLQLARSLDRPGSSKRPSPPSRKLRRHRPVDPFSYHPDYLIKSNAPSMITIFATEFYFRSSRRFI